MARLFWIAVGAGAGVYAVRKLTKTVEQYSPAGMSDSFSSSLASFGDGLREVAEVIREGMAEREQELRSALGVDASGAPAMDPRTAQSLMDDPTGPSRGARPGAYPRYDDEDEFGFDQPGNPRNY
ncbi:DUF6167 family protein [Kineosporia babensis]|uniref:DUF6167 family protein n=1 Tax=Kineosporia babensis TaxID=499548 RepID=A0A9X1SXU9_9ACTN|nr:DUF6167 family protein [Kineosporia babensis]MCD5316361.1 DUF6167 family protein [Kineosporia babensis]